MCCWRRGKLVGKVIIRDGETILSEAPKLDTSYGGATFGGNDKSKGNVQRLYGNGPDEFDQLK